MLYQKKARVRDMGQQSKRTATLRRHPLPIFKQYIGSGRYLGIHSPGNNDSRGKHVADMENEVS